MSFMILTLFFSHTLCVWKGMYCNRIEKSSLSKLTKIYFFFRDIFWCHVDRLLRHIATTCLLCDRPKLSKWTFRLWMCAIYYMICLIGNIINYKWFWVILNMPYKAFWMLSNISAYYSARSLPQIILFPANEMNVW